MGPMCICILYIIYKMDKYEEKVKHNNNTVMFFISRTSFCFSRISFFWFFFFWMHAIFRSNGIYLQLYLFEYHLDRGEYKHRCYCSCGMLLHMSVQLQRDNTSWHFYNFLWEGLEGLKCFIGEKGF